MGSRWGVSGGGGGFGGGNYHGGKYDVVNPSLELADPTPDIHALFVSFNELFFEGRLSSVLVQWSPRMTLCAGVCRFRGKAGGCSIHLSKPLLSLRSRKELVETLLHEMIHAYLFLWDREKEDHGPKFKAKMNQINALTGANITVYHSFHDEVDHHKTHWWKCNGPCVARSPYFGIVKRSMNRAPGKNDFWWAEHARTCGGTYTKIKEPAPKTKGQCGKAKAGAGVVNGKQRDIASYFQNGAGHVLGGGSSCSNRGVSSGLPLATPSCSATSSSSSSMDMSGSAMEVKKERNSIFGSGLHGNRLGGTLGITAGPSTSRPAVPAPVGRGNHPLLALWESGKKNTPEEPTRPSPTDDEDVVFLDKTMCPFCGEAGVGDFDSHIDLCCPVDQNGSNNGSSNGFAKSVNGFNGLASQLNGKRKVEEEDEVERKKRKTEEMVLECPICGSGFDSSVAVDIHIDECTSNSAMFS